MTEPLGARVVPDAGPHTAPPDAGLHTAPPGAPRTIAEPAPPPPASRPETLPNRTAAIGALCALCLTAFTYVTTEGLPIGLLPLISSDLGASRSAVGLLVTGYGLTVAAAAVPLTHLTRRVPRRRLLGTLLVVLVASSLLTAAAWSYPVLLVGRVCTAVTQAVFWSVAPPAAAALFAPEIRGRVATVLVGGSSIAVVLGVPTGTWLGQQAGWRVAFLALAGLGLLAMLATVALIPPGAPEQSHATRGAEPDRRRYAILVMTTALVVTGAFTAYTYIAPFFTDLTGFAAAAIGPLLLVRGAAGLVGVVVVGTLVDRWPRVAIIAPVVLLVLASFGQYLLAASRAGAVSMMALSGLALAALAASLQSRALQVAPGSTDLALAGNTVAFNLGIGGGALIGAGLLPAAGVRSTPFVGGLVALAALGVMLAEPLIAGTRRAKRA